MHPATSRMLRRVVVATCALAALCLAVPAHAGGIYANELGTPEMGTAGAGAEASALDASTAIPFYNPAGMTRLDGDQLIVAGGVLFASAEFNLDSATTISGGNGGDAAGPIPLLTVAWVHSFSDRFKFGLSMFTAAGALLDYENDWAGRYQAQRSGIATIALSPTVAYRINDWFSIGGGINIMASALEMQVAGLIGPNDPNIVIDGSDTQVSFNLSMMFEPTETTRIGLSWVSETEFDFEGDVVRNPSGQTAPTNTTLTLAQVLRVGLHHDFSERTAFVGTLGWEAWSAMENQFVSIGEAGTLTLPRNWDDTYRIGAGIHQRVGEPWLLRFGLMYDSSPTRAEDRTADLPVDEQFRIAAGFQNQKSEKFEWGVELAYADLGAAAIDSSGLVGDLVGDYKSNDYLAAAFNLQWRF